MEDLKNAFKQPIILASRGSALASWQAEHTKNIIESKNLACNILFISTTGDKMQKGALANYRIENLPQEIKHLATGKGLFIKEIQEALYEKKAHLAVHSMKDLPTAQTENLTIAACLKRENNLDAICFSPKYSHFSKWNFNNLSLNQKEELKNLKFGTTSARRRLQLSKFILNDINQNEQNELNVHALRGNIDSRLKKLENTEYDAILLASAGLRRLSLWNSSCMAMLPKEYFIPAPAQGIIALEISENNFELLEFLHENANCPKATLEAVCERAVLKMLGGDCHTAIAVSVWQDNGTSILLEMQTQNNWYGKNSFEVSEQAILELKELCLLKNYTAIFNLVQSKKIKIAYEIETQLKKLGFSLQAKI
jgi:hydroxymethylbilane synthase